MTRRTLISGAPALLLHRALKAQRPTAHEPVGGRYRIPATPVARYNFHRLGQSLQEGATITNVPDDSGNGNPLIIDTSVAAQTPMYTNHAINGRGAFWPGAVLPSSSMSQTPSCTPKGGLVSTSNMSPTLTESPLSILYCYQGGADELAGGDMGFMFQAGNNLNFARRGSDGSYNKCAFWYNYNSGHGTTAASGAISFAGPVAGVAINGWAGVANQGYLACNRSNVTYSGNLNGTTLGANPFKIGANTTQPYGCLYHEVVIYNRVLTAAEVLQWRVYCNQMYSAPLDSQIVRRFVFIGDSITNGHNSLWGLSGPNVVASVMGWTTREFINHGVGSSTLAGHNTNISYLTGALDSGLGAANNVAVLTGGYYNEFSAGYSAAQTYADAKTLLASLKAGGYGKVYIQTMLSGQNYAGQNNGNGINLATYFNGLNASILSNAMNDGFDGVINTTATNPYDPGFEAYMTANGGGHLSQVLYTRWFTIVGNHLLSFGL
jgi:hypothetical protein